MYYTRSSKQCGTASNLKSKAQKVISSETVEAKQNFVSSSGRVVLSLKNKSDHENSNKSTKNIPLSVGSKIKTVSLCKTPSLSLCKSNHNNLRKNKNCALTAVNKENITEKEQTVINKDCKGRKCSTNKKKSNIKNLIPKSNAIQNKSLNIIRVDKENGDTSRNKSKSLNLSKESIPHHKPVWKMCPNNNQESKKRPIDIYDITEDDDLKMEGFCKKKKIDKQKKTKLKKPIIKAKNSVKKSHHDKVFNSETKVLLENDNTKLTYLKENNAAEKNTLQKPDLLLKNEKGNFKIPDEVTIISQNKQVNGKVTSNKVTHSGSKESLNDVKIDHCKQIHREVSPARSMQPGSKQTSNDGKIDLGKQIPKDVTSVRDIQPGFKQPSSILNKQDFNTNDRVLIPQMTSTPEKDDFCLTTTYLPLGDSYIVRAPEILAIPVITSNLEVDDSLDEELVYSSKPTCSRVENPRCSMITKKKTESSLKQIKINEFVDQSETTAFENVTERTKNTEKDLKADSWDLFISPVKKKGSLKSNMKLMDFSRVNKANKPKKANENRENFKVNIEDSKKTCDKDKSAAEIKDEEFLKSMNEHFSELESFELCIE